MHRARGRDLGRDPGGQVAAEQAAREHERGAPAAAAQRVRHDAAARLAHPLAPRQLGRRDNLGLAAQQLAGVSHQALRAGRQVGDHRPVTRRQRPASAGRAAGPDPPERGRGACRA